MEQTGCDAENVGVGSREIDFGGENNKYLITADHKERTV